MTLLMTREEREMFLADLHVALVSIPEEARGPLTVPIWQAYEPGGEVRFVTGRTSRKGRLLQQGRRASLCVHTERPPYQYVSVEGPIVAVDRADIEWDLRPLARRYLGTQAGDAYVAESRDEHLDKVLVRLRPERWLTADYAKMGASS